MSGSGAGICAHIGIVTYYPGRCPGISVLVKCLARTDNFRVMLVLPA